MCKLGMISQELLNIEIMLLLSANRKSFMLCRLARQRMTLSDLEWHRTYLCGTWASCSPNSCSYKTLILGMQRQLAMRIMPKYAASIFCIWQTQLRLCDFWPSASWKSFSFGSDQMKYSVLDNASGSITAAPEVLSEQLSQSISGCPQHALCRLHSEFIKAVPNQDVDCSVSQGSFS